MQAIKLGAKIREITGKKVKRLRNEGILPATVYGKDVKSAQLSVPLAEFMKVYDEVGETGLVELSFDGKSQHTLVSNVQIHPVTRRPLHVEFHAVKLTEKIKASVPLEMSGESPAVANGVGVLLQTISEVEVEALPADLPEKISVDVSGLTEVDQQVTVGDLKVGSKVTLLTPVGEIVLKVVPAVAEETKKELEAEEAARAAAAAAEAPAVAEAEVPAAGPVAEEETKGVASETVKEEKKE
jgi:large subunit ribosomal protein L25